MAWTWPLLYGVEGSSVADRKVLDAAMEPLSGEAPMTLEAIGRKIGVTRERVRQIEAAALERLRRLMAARGVEAQDLF